MITKSTITYPGCGTAKAENPHDERIFRTAEELVYSTASRAFYLPDRRDFPVTAHASSTERRDGDGNTTMNGQLISVCSMRILAPITISPIPPIASAMRPNLSPMKRPIRMPSVAIKKVVFLVIDGNGHARLKGANGFFSSAQGI